MNNYNKDLYFTETSLNSTDSPSHLNNLMDFILKKKDKNISVSNVYWIQHIFLFYKRNWIVGSQLHTKCTKYQ